MYLDHFTLLCFLVSSPVSPDRRSPVSPVREETDSMRYLLICLIMMKLHGETIQSERVKLMQFRNRVCPFYTPYVLKELRLTVYCPSPQSCKQLSAEMLNHFTDAGSRQKQGLSDHTSKFNSFLMDQIDCKRSSWRGGRRRRR